MDDMNKIVELVFNFEAEDALELEDFKELCGGAFVYNAIFKFKNVNNGEERAIKFLHKMNDAGNIIDLF